MQQHDMRKFMEAFASHERERQAKEIADAQLRVVTASFDKAAAYSNLILLAGYAGFFGLWQLTKPYLSKSEALWSALFVLLSLACFVIFEVVKMAFTQSNVVKQAKTLRSSENLQDPKRLVQELNRLNSAQEANSNKFMFWWAVSLIFSVTTGFFGAGVIVYAFITGLVG